MIDQDDATDLLKTARKFVNGNTSTEYLLVHKRESGPEIGELEFRRTVQNELEMLTSEVLTDFINKLRDGTLSVRDLAAGNTLTDKSLIQHSSKDELPDTDLFRALTTDPNYSPTRYDKDDRPDFQLIKISDGNKDLIGIQNHQSLKTYDASKSGIPLMYNNTVYSKFDGDLLIIPDSLNAIYFDGHIFVRTPKSFEKMFDMREQYERKAKSVIDNFEKTGIKFSDDKVKNEWLAQGEIRILRKLYAVHDNEIPKYATPDKVGEIIDKYGVGVNYKKKNGHIELDIDQYTDVWKLLRVLNSDYAEAELIPDAKLEIESKRILD